MKLRKDLIDYIYFGFFGIIVILFITGQFTQVTGTTLVVIDNADPNSMFPTYFQGDLFVIHKDSADDISVGDVIVYSSSSGSRVIHRVIDIVKEGGETFFRVKGDDPVTNYRPDRVEGGSLIPFDNVLGKVITRLPYVGHISLAMQQNPVVQIFVYMLAIILAAAILFWPDDEEEDEEEYYDLTKKSICEFRQSVLSRIRGIYFALTKSKYKLVAWLIIFSLLLVGFLPFFLPTFLPMPTGLERGVTNVTVQQPLELNENLAGEDIIFYQVLVQMYDNGYLFDHISGYEMEVETGNGTLLDYSVWDTLRPIKGKFMIGGSITIEADIIDDLGADTELFIEITVQIDQLGGQITLEPYQTSFVLG